MNSLVKFYIVRIHQKSTVEERLEYLNTTVVEKLREQVREEYEKLYPGELTPAEE